MPFVYIVRCRDRSLYVGHTTDVAARLTAHNQGRGGRHTAKRRPVTLIYSESHESLSAAVDRESQLKRWSKAKKEALIAGDILGLKKLAKRHQKRPENPA